MNRIFKVVFSQVLGRHVVVSELASSIQRGACKAVVVGVLAAAAGSAWAGVTVTRDSVNAGGTIDADTSAWGATAAGYVLDDGTIYVKKNAKGALALGYASGSSAKISVGSQGWGATAMGSAENSKVAVGDSAYGAMARGHAKNSEEGITATGRGSIASGDATGSGNYIKAQGYGALAMGSASNESDLDEKHPHENEGRILAEGDGSMAIGTNVWAKGHYSIALGKGSTAESDNSLAALGGKTSGTGSLAIGVNAQAKQNNTFAIGSSAEASQTNTIAIGNSAMANAANSVALGSSTSVTQSGGVALGYQSVASTGTSRGGYNVATGVTDYVDSANQSAWKSTAAAVSVGNASNNITRQIVGVAAGSDDTDAVNVAQLKMAATAATAASTAAAAAAKTVVSQGTNVKVSADSTTAADGHVTYTVSGYKTTLNQGKNVSLTSVSSDDGLTMAYTVAVDKVGISNGTANYDAGTITVTNADGSTSTITGLKNTYVTSGALQNNKLNLTRNDGGVVTVDGIASTSDTKTYMGDSGSYVVQPLSKTLNVKGNNTSSDLTEGNIGVVSGGDTLTVKLAKDLKGLNSIAVGSGTTINSSGLTISGGPSVTTSGIDAGNKPITNVTAGTAATDAVNVSQLKGARTTVSVGGNAVGTTGRATDGKLVLQQTTNNETGAYNYDLTLSDTVATTDSGMTYAGDVNSATVKLNKQVKVQGGATGDMTNGNIGVNYNTTDKQIEIKLAKDLKDLNSAEFSDESGNQTRIAGTGVTVTTADGQTTRVDGSGITIIPSDGGNAVSLTEAGLDNGGNKITNVAAGVNDTDAVNVWQLNNKLAEQSDELVSKGLNFKGNANADADGVHKNLGETLTIRGATANDDIDNGKFTDSNIKTVTDGNGDLVIMTAKNLTDVDSISLNGATGSNGDPGSTTVTVIDGKPGVDGVEGEDSITRIAYTDPDGGGHQVATLDDGTKYRGDNGVIATRKLNEVLDIKGGAEGALSENNIGVNYDTGSGAMKIQLAKDIKDIDTVQVNSSVTVGSGDSKTTITGDTITTTTINTQNITVNGADITAKAGYDGQRGEKGANGVDGTDGTTRIVYKDGGKERQVATMDDGMKYGGDFGNTAAVKLNNTVNIVGEAASQDDLTSGNIGVVASQDGDNAKLTVKLNKDVNLGDNGSVTIGDTKITNNSVKTTTVNAATVNATTVAATTFQAGDTTINSDGMTINNGPAITKNNVDMGGQQIHNVAAGTADTDAVNVSQMNQMKSDFGRDLNKLHGRISEVDKDASAGVAMALAAASLPQVYLPGKNMMAVAGGTYRGESGFAIGFSSSSDDGKWIIKANATTNSQGHYGAAVGAGYMW